MFDTCVFRPFAKPTDIFYLLEAQNGVINFSELRQKAEAVARQKTSKRQTIARAKTKQPIENNIKRNTHSVFDTVVLNIFNKR